MEVAAVRKGKSDVTQLAARSRFGRFAPEKEQTVRKAEVKEGEVLEQLKTAWRGCSYDATLLSDEENYFSILKTITGLVYSSEDVERFSLALAEFQNEDNFHLKAGLFLSALINYGNENDYTIHTRHLSNSPGDLGYHNSKNIIVEGDVGRNIGFNMIEGSITVEGDAGGAVGFWMQGGSITVNGDADWDPGFHMLGGEIHLNGSFIKSKSGPVRHDGKIYHKGKLIYHHEKGELLYKNLGEFYSNPPVEETRFSLWRRFLVWIKG